jgi:hypothetical protein
VRIPRSQVKKIERSTVSLMPAGFDQTLSETELTDLLAFLQAEKDPAQLTIEQNLQRFRNATQS